MDLVYILTGLVSVQSPCFVLLPKEIDTQKYLNKGII